MRIHFNHPFVIVLAFIAVLVQHPALAQEEVILYPRVRLDPGTASNRLANEFSATARGLEVVGLWMKEPPNDADSSNNSRLVIRSPTLFSGTLTTKTTFNRTSTLADPAEIDLRIEGFSNRTSTTAIVRLKNRLDGTWRQVDTYDVPVTSDDNHYKRGMPVTGTDPITSIDWDFIRDSDGRIEVQVEHQRLVTTGITNFDSAFDFVQIVVVGE